VHYFYTADESLLLTIFQTEQVMTLSRNLAKTYSSADSSAQAEILLHDYISNLPELSIITKPSKPPGLLQIMAFSSRASG
jgi:HD superfamily phosphohydrolase YqeK